MVSPSVEVVIISMRQRRLMSIVSPKRLFGWCDPRPTPPLYRTWWKAMVQWHGFSSAWSKLQAISWWYDEDLSDEYAKSQSTIRSISFVMRTCCLWRLEALNESDRTNEAIPVLQVVRDRASLPLVLNTISKTMLATLSEMNAAKNLALSSIVSLM